MDKSIEDHISAASGEYKELAVRDSEAFVSQMLKERTNSEIKLLSAYDDFLQQSDVGDLNGKPILQAEFKHVLSRWVISKWKRVSQKLFLNLL